MHFERVGSINAIFLNDEGSLEDSGLHCTALNAYHSILMERADRLYESGFPDYVYACLTF